MGINWTCEKNIINLTTHEQERLTTQAERDTHISSQVYCNSQQQLPRKMSIVLGPHLKLQVA